jgi:hypothetical protein
MELELEMEMKEEIIARRSVEAKVSCRYLRRKSKWCGTINTKEKELVYV